MIKEVGTVLGITPKYATTKHAQTNSLLERTQAVLKEALRSETGERRSVWQKYVNIAVLNYNTSSHRSKGYEPNRLFHARVPFNVFDLRMGIRPQKPSILKSQIAQDLFEQTETIFQAVRKNAIQAFIE